jgi:hypothetical protein
MSRRLAPESGWHARLAAFCTSMPIVSMGELNLQLRPHLPFLFASVRKRARRTLRLRPIVDSLTLPATLGHSTHTFLKGLSRRLPDAPTDEQFETATQEMVSGRRLHALATVAT